MASHLETRRPGRRGSCCRLAGGPLTPSRNRCWLGDVGPSAMVIASLLISVAGRFQYSGNRPVITASCQFGRQRARKPRLDPDGTVRRRRFERPGAGVQQGRGAAGQTVPVVRLEQDLQTHGVAAGVPAPVHADSKLAARRSAVEFGPDPGTVKVEIRRMSGHVKAAKSWEERGNRREILSNFERLF
jgi:hypothetical protein